MNTALCALPTASPGPRAGTHVERSDPVCQGLPFRRGAACSVPSHVHLSGHPFTYVALFWGVKSRTFPAVGVMGTHRAHFCTGGESTQGRKCAAIVFVQGELGSTFIMQSGGGDSQNKWQLLLLFRELNHKVLF